MCRNESQLATDRTNCESSVSDARDAEKKFRLQIVSVDDVEFDNVLCDAAVSGNR